MRKQFKGFQTTLPGTFGANCNSPPALKLSLDVLCVGSYSDGTYRGLDGPALQPEIQQKLKAATWTKSHEDRNNVKCASANKIHSSSETRSAC